MENNEILKDDFLGDLVRQSTPDIPSGDFTGRVMEQILAAPETVPAWRKIIRTLILLLPFLLIAALVAIILVTSDIPVLQWLFSEDPSGAGLFPFGVLLADAIETAFSSRYVTMGLMVMVSAGLLYGIDRFFTRERMAA